MRIRLAAIATAALTAACGSKRAAPPEPVRVPVTIDGATVGDVAVPASGRRPLAELLPATAPGPDRWRSILLHSGSRQVATEDLPGDFPDHTVMIEAGIGGGATVGIFREPTPGAPDHVRRRLEAPRLSLDRVDAIAISTEVPPPRDAIEIVFVSADGTERRASIADFPDAARARDTTGYPGANRRVRGWKLSGVVTGLTGAAPGDHVTLVLSTGEQVRIPVDEALIRTNARGYFVVTLQDADAGVRKWRGVERVLL